MRALLLGVPFSFALLTLLPESAGGEEKAAPTNDKVAAPKAPDFAGYQWVTMMTGEVVKADDSKVTVRVFWQQVVANGNNRGSRPSLHGNHGRSHHSPFATRRANSQLKWEHHDYDLPYVAESLVRNKTLPPKTNPDGKRGFYSAKEQDELNLPYAAPGYQAIKSDLVPGTIIEAHIIRDKNIPANKVADGDLRIKYAVVLRHDPNPPKDIVSPTPAKKN